MPVITQERIEQRIGAGGPGGPRGDGGGGRGPDNGERRRRRAYRTGIWIALAPMLMLFAAFGSSYIVRRGLSDDWRPLRLPAVLWLNTALLLLSSVTLERARTRLKQPFALGFTRWWAVTTALGVAFVVGQLLAWWQLNRLGVYLASNPSSSFFYLLTAAHGVHLLGGLAALGYVTLRAAREVIGPGSRTAVDVTAVYWHFLGLLWVLIFALLIIWR